MTPTRFAPALFAPATALLLALLAACTPLPPRLAPYPAYGTAPPGPALADRIVAATLSANQPAPLVDQPTVPGGPDGPVPILRLVFPGEVFFDSNADLPRADARPILEAMANEVQARPDIGLTIVGHTDAVGSDAFNMDLSRRRSTAVANALLAAGAAPPQLHTLAMGLRQPVADDATEAGRARNRRVEFLFSRSAAASQALAGVLPLPAPALAPLPAPVSVPASAPLPATLPRPFPRAAARSPLAPGATAQNPAAEPVYRPNTLPSYQPRQLGPTQPF